MEYLLEWLEKSGVKDVLPELLKTRVYVGFSAGSMVTAGLGFVDFEIHPHLNSPRFPKVRLDHLEKIADENPTPFYALDDSSAVKVDGDIVSVVSEGEWKKFN